MRKTLEDFLEIYQDPQYTEDYLKEMLREWANIDFKGFPYSPDTFHATYELGFLDDNQVCKIFFSDGSRYIIKTVEDILTKYNDFSYAIVFSRKETINLA